MRTMRWVTSVVLGLALAVSWYLPLTAQEGGGVTTAPVQITVQATREDAETRLVLLRADAPVTGLAIVPLDLVSADGKKVLPARVIQVDLPATTIAAQGLLTVPVRFYLGNVPSGQFSGELLISYDGGSQSLPVNVAVKDLPWWALGALVGGVALGIGVSTYRAQGRPRDEILVQLGQIQTQIRVDKDLSALGQPFLKRIEAEMVDVDVALSGQRWDEARKDLTAAEAIWTKWRRDRPDWLEQLNYYKTLVGNLEGEASIFYVNEIRNAANSAYINIPDLETPGKFRELLSPLVKNLNDFKMLDAQLSDLAASGQSARVGPLRTRLHTLKPADEGEYKKLTDEIEIFKAQAQQSEARQKISDLETMYARLPDAESERWRPRMESLREQMSNMESATPADYKALSGEIAQTTEQMARLLEDTAGMSFAIPKGGTETAMAQLALLSDAPQTRVQPAQAMAKAKLRLRWFTWLTYGVAVIFLALSGFVELYGSRPDFGAGGIADYFTLLAWGFGAEATRAAVADMVQGWGIPQGK